jgi:hypothetical protein
MSVSAVSCFGGVRFVLTTPHMIGWSASYGYGKLCDCLLKVSLCLFFDQDDKSTASVDTETIDFRQM